MTEKKFLIILETLKELRNVILRHESEVVVDYSNITYENIESAYQRIQRWKSLMQEFGGNSTLY